MRAQCRKSGNSVHTIPSSIPAHASINKNLQKCFIVDFDFHAFFSFLRYLSFPAISFDYEVDGGSPRRRASSARKSVTC